MKNITKYTLRLLSIKQKLLLSLILVFSIIVSFSELIGLGSVALFVTLIADTDYRKPGCFFFPFFGKPDFPDFRKS